MSRDEFESLIHACSFGKVLEYEIAKPKVMAEFDKLQAENDELKRALEQIAIDAELASMGDTSDMQKPFPFKTKDNE